ncbi:hypothetical protein GBA52_003645 [Prunus armeniaca]|nr:hypothetical protein GBA52_003645 [Prunus armeniaca]
MCLEQAVGARLWQSQLPVLEGGAIRAMGIFTLLGPCRSASSKFKRNLGLGSTGCILEGGRIGKTCARDPGLKSFDRS